MGLLDDAKQIATSALPTAAGAAASAATGPGKIVVQVDPAWPYYDVWRSPIGRKFVEVVNFSYDEGFDEQHQPNYDTETIAGRAEPYVAFQHMDAPTFTLPFTLFAACDAGQTDINRAIDEEVMQPWAFLCAVKHPFRVGGVTHAPPPVVLTIGRNVTARGVVTSCTGNGKDAFDSLSLRPHRIDVSLTLQVARRTISDFYDGSRRFL